MRRSTWLPLLLLPFVLSMLLAASAQVAEAQTPHEKKSWSWRRMFGLSEKSEAKESSLLGRPRPESNLGRPSVPDSRPSPIKQVGYQAKRAWTKTVDVLTPDRPETKPQRPQRGFDLSRRGEEKKPSFWSRMFGKKEPEGPSSSVTGFLGQPRP